MTSRRYFKHLPWALPVLVFLFDVADMEWLFSHEPSLTSEVVWRSQLLLLPGSLFGSAIPAILLNCGLAMVIGTVASWILTRLPKGNSN
jgi:hypothetical protein